MYKEGRTDLGKDYPKGFINDLNYNKNKMAKL